MDKAVADEQPIIENIFGSVSNEISPDAARHMKLDSDAGRSTPPWRGRSTESTPAKVPEDDGGREDPDEIPLSMFSVVKQEPNGDPDDHDNGGHGGPGGSGGGNDRQTLDNEGRDSKEEFQLVNSRNVEIVRFAGTMGCKITYIDFNDCLRNYIAIKGKDREVLNKLLTSAEKRGDEPITSDTLRAIATRIPKIYEYNRAIHSAFAHLTVGEAKELVTFGVNGGLDVWRRLLYNEYFPIDQTRQDIILTEIISLEPVKEKDVRAFLNRVK